MTTKVEKSICLQLNYGWAVTGIAHEKPQLFSKKFTYKNTEILRVGIKTLPGATSSSNRPPILFLLTANLQKMGLKILAVSYLKWDFGLRSSGGLKEIEMDQKDLTNAGNSNKEKNYGAAGIQLFTSSANLLKHRMNFVTDFMFAFTVYLTGIGDNYRVQQMDSLLSQQLRISIENQEDIASFKLIANDGKSFAVHKWMLAARSPVFAALFSSNEEIGSIHLAVDCNANEMNQFIQFIYTGELVGLVSNALMQLAVNYEIKTLRDICEAALQDVDSIDKIAVAAWHLESGFRWIYSEKNDPDVEFFEKMGHNVEQEVSTFTCTWNVQNLAARENQETIKMSASFEHGGKKMFSAWLEMKKSPDHPGKYTVSALTFFSYSHESMGYKIYQVTCSIGGQDKNSLTYQETMKRDTVPNGRKTSSLKVFKIYEHVLGLATPCSCPFVLTFHVELFNTVLHFINVPMDVTCGEQLWAAAVNRKLTDVEFLVGEEAFDAHRSLLSARSPVFAAMFASGMKEAKTGQVRIEDANPDTFQRFLKFLYTGMLEPSAMDKELFAVADKYQVSTLMELCRPAAHTADTDDGILKAFLSL